MTPIFPNSGNVTAFERLLLRGGSLKKTIIPVRYGIFQHPTAGVVLIDTGYGPRVCTGPRTWGLRAYNSVFGPTLLPDQSPIAVLAKTGYSPLDVRHVIVTHFHADHIAGLRDFPNARFLAHRQSYRNLAPTIRTRMQQMRNLRHGNFIELLPDDFANRIDDIDAIHEIEAPLGLGLGRDIFGDGTVLSIDLPGHAEGHFGVCFPGGPRPILYAVDVQWMARAIYERRIPGLPARIISHDHGALIASAARVAAFGAAGGDIVLCHDPAPGPYDYIPHDNSGSI